MIRYEVAKPWDQCLMPIHGLHWCLQERGHDGPHACTYGYAEHEDCPWGMVATERRGGTLSC